MPKIRKPVFGIPPDRQIAHSITSTSSTRLKFHDMRRNYISSNVQTDLKVKVIAILL
jgi:hypothetical protein